MYKWNATALAIGFLLICTAPATAQDFDSLQGRSFCGIDRNGDGDYDGEGEIASCDNGVCPLTAAECVTNRVHQVCDPDRQETSCAPDETVEECEPDIVTRQCDPDTQREVCDPDTTARECDPDIEEQVCEADTTRRVCDPDTTRRECDPDTSRQECDPSTTRRVCDPSTTRRVCDPSTTRRVCDPSTTRRVCDPSTTRRVCDPSTTRRVCDPSTRKRVCEADTIRRVCTTLNNRQCSGPRGSSRSCVTCTNVIERGLCRWVTVPGQCRNVTTPGRCRNVTTPGRCRNVTTPGRCRNVTTPGRCRNVTTPGACRNVTTPGQCRTVNVPGQCRDVTVAGPCRDEVVPGECQTVIRQGECRDVTVPGACRNETVPGECRDVTVPGVCTTRTVPGECVQITVPGECRNEPLPDSCPIEGIDECFVGSDGVSRCSDTQCVNTSNAPIENLKPERVAFVNDGDVDASGQCLNDIQVFTGRGMNCRRPGLLTLFKNCCKNRGTVMRDSTGSIVAAAGVSTVITVFNGAQAAVSALASGASVASAASSGTAALAAAGGPAAIGAGVYLLFTELLNFGCNQEDMETGMLNGSDMCTYVGSYCTARIPLIGCIQKSRTFCCFNSKLGRIIHEQGRVQLKNFDGFGEPKNPECRGFTPAEFQALNFTDMDLSEYYSELQGRSEAQLKETFEQGLEAFVNMGSEE